MSYEKTESEYKTRNYTRTTIELPITVNFENSDKANRINLKGNTIDISDGGLGILLEEKNNINLPTDNIISIYFPNKKKIKLTSKLLWNKRIENKIKYGASISNVQNEELTVLKNYLNKIKINTKENVEPKHEKDNLIKKSFVKNIDELTEYLAFIKKEFDTLDKQNNKLNERIEYLEKKKISIFKTIDKYFDTLWEMINEVKTEVYLIYKEYCQRKLLPFFICSPFNRRIYEKPLGYPGDYIMMKYIYEDGYDGNTTYKKLIHRYTCEMPAAVANKRRKNYFKNKIIDVIKKNNDNAKITNIACGPAKEVIETVKEENIKNSVFTLIDFEKMALEDVDKNINRIDKKIKINYICSNVLSLLRKRLVLDIITDQDLIYSAGLIDYLSNKVASRLIEILYGSLSEGGMLILGNVHKNNPSRFSMDILAEWTLNYRDENDMLDLAKNITSSKKKYVEKEILTGMNIFLLIQK